MELIRNEKSTSKKSSRQTISIRSITYKFTHPTREKGKKKNPLNKMGSVFEGTVNTSERTHEASQKTYGTKLTLS
jgi:hypothetical protein